MTDPKKPRQPRELSFTAAVEKLRRIAGKHDPDRAAERAANMARLDAVVARAKSCAAVLAKLPEAVHAAAYNEADRLGPIFEPDEGDVQAGGSMPSMMAMASLEEPAPAIPEGGVTVPAAELPRGALPMSDERAANVARLTGRGR